MDTSDTLLLARAQFGLNIAFHILFPTITIGLAWILVYFRAQYALTGERMFLGHFEQAAGCINVLDVGDEWIVRAVNVAPLDLLHASTRETTMEGYWAEFQPYTANE